MNKVCCPLSLQGGAAIACLRSDSINPSRKVLLQSGPLPTAAIRLGGRPKLPANLEAVKARGSHPGRFNEMKK